MLLSCHLRAELLGAAIQKVKPRRVAASEAGAERVSNPLSSGKYFARPWWAPSEAVRAEILVIENQWATAIERQDAAAFERLAAEDFRFIDEDGRLLNRAQYIAARSHNPENVESAVQDQIEVRQYGDAAMATGRSIIRGTRAGVPFTYGFRWTDMYVQRKGRWQAVSAQLTALSPKVE